MLPVHCDIKHFQSLENINQAEAALSYNSSNS